MKNKLSKNEIKKLKNINVEKSKAVKDKKDILKYNDDILQGIR